MSRKIKPNLLRLGLTKSWPSRWFFKKPLKFFLEEDCRIREIIKEKLPNAGVASVEIERTREDIVVSIKSNRPGLVIGRGGRGVEDLQESLVENIKKLRKEHNTDLKFSLRVNVVELRRTELSAPVIAGQVVSDLERRLPYRLVLKRHLRFIEQNREIKGAKIKISGRLGGAEIARSQHLSFGKMPLQTLRADIDYGEATAFTTYGTIGVKVWLYKGEVFDASAEETEI